MADSRWLKVLKNFLSDDRSMKIWTILVIAVIGSAVMVFAISGMEENIEYHSEGPKGIVIDYGNYNTVWVPIDPTETLVDDPVELLKVACKNNNATPIFEGEKLVEIKTGDKIVSNDPDHEWGLWYVEKGKCNFEKSDTYKIRVSDYTVVSWAYTENGKEPTVAVDASGKSIYGYLKPSNVGVLSPMCRYIAEPMGKYNIVDRTLDRNSIMKENDDIVLCDGSIPVQYRMAGNLRDLGVNCVVIYNPKTLKDVINNIFITGTVVGYDDLDIAMENINKALDKIKEQIGQWKGYETLITLGADDSIWVAGRDTYAHDIIELVSGQNALENIEDKRCVDGWMKIPDFEIPVINPDVIIILDPNPFDEYKGKYKNKSEDMKMSMSDNWKRSSAYLNGKIYLFTGDLGMMAQCPGPRILEFVMTMAKVINPDAFFDEKGSNPPLPNEIDKSDYIIDLMGRRTISTP